MGVTTNYNFPYPDGIDPVAIPLDMQELAAAIDSQLYTVANTIPVATPEIVFSAGSPAVPTVGLVWIDTNG